MSLLGVRSGVRSSIFAPPMKNMEVFFIGVGSRRSEKELLTGRLLEYMTRLRVRVASLVCKHWDQPINGE